MIGAPCSASNSWKWTSHKQSHAIMAVSSRVAAVTGANKGIGLAIGISTGFAQPRRPKLTVLQCAISPSHTRRRLSGAVLSSSTSALVRPQEALPLSSNCPMIPSSSKQRSWPKMEATQPSPSASSTSATSPASIPSATFCAKSTQTALMF